MKTILNILKITAWVVASFFIGLLYAAFLTGFFDALGRGDMLNIITMPLFIGLFATVHYLLLWTLNYFTYRDYSVAFRFFPMLKEKQGFGIAFSVCALPVLFGVAALPVIVIHLYFTLVVFGILRPREKRYPTPTVPHDYTPAPTTPASTSYTTASTPIVKEPVAQEPVTARKTYDLDSYRRYMQSNLVASDIYVDCGYSQFVRSASVSYLSVSVSGGDTPSVRATATVSLYVNNAAIRSYIGVDSHHNSTTANSNVVDSEVKSSLSRARDSATSAIEDKIRQLTRSFAAANGGAPDSVRESASVSVQKR